MPETATTLLSFALLGLLVTGCDQASAPSESPAVDSVAVGAAAGATARDMVALQREARMTMAPQMAPAPATLESRVARRTANDAGGVSLGSPLPPMDPSGAMLIRNGRASIEVARVDDAVAKLRQTATQFGGFVANTAIVGGNEEHRTAELEIRVPSGQFDAAVAALGSLGKVESVSASVQDVGDEYVDLSARVANARHMEARLVEMLARRTGRLSEALTVEQELRRVREEIERYDARLKWLERRTALSSLDVSMHEPLPLIERQPGPGPLAEAFAEAWARAIGVLAWCIAMLGVLLPLLAIGLCAALLARRLLRPGTPPGVSGA
jgi:hypothetical protein